MNKVMATRLTIITYLDSVPKFLNKPEPGDEQQLPIFLDDSSWARVRAL